MEWLNLEGIGDKKRKKGIRFLIENVAMVL
jgi:hypothetical protein